jgi:hypothetical protein
MASAPAAISQFHPQVHRRSVTVRARKFARKLQGGGVLAALVSLVGASAAGQVPAGPDPTRAGAALVVLRSPRCAVASPLADQFAQLFAIELSGAELRLVKDEPLSSADLLVEVDDALCRASAQEVGVSIVRTATGARTAQIISFHDVEENARPRALALAIAELVRAQRTRAESDPAAVGQEREHAASPVPQDRPSSPAESSSLPLPRAEEPVEEHPFAGVLEAAGAWRYFAPQSTPLFGITAALALGLRPTWLRARADAAGSWSSFSDPLGDIGLSVYSGGLSVLATTGRRLELEIGPHFELGYARAVGLPSGPSSAPSSEGHPIALVSLTTGARFWFDRWAAFTDIDLGAAVFGAEIFADDRRVATVQGAFLCARVGIAFGY